jgi:hypothetical protein
VSSGFPKPGAIGWLDTKVLEETGDEQLPRTGLGGLILIEFATRFINDHKECGFWL